MANKNKRPHCCKHYVSAVGQCKCFKDFIFQHCICAVYPQTNVRGVLGHSERCKPLRARSHDWLRALLIHNQVLKTSFPTAMHGHSTQTILFLFFFFPSTGIYQEITKFQIWWVSTKRFNIWSSPPFLFSSRFYLSSVTVTVSWLLWDKLTV